MRYKLENGNLVPVTFIVTSEYVISNLTDEMIDSYKGAEGKILDESAPYPTITDKQYLKAIYTETSTSIVKEYEVCEIAPSELDKLKDKANTMQERISATETAIFGLMR